MISLIALAHRVSSVHTKYANIHASVFNFSFKRLTSRLNKNEPTHCDFERELSALCEELRTVKTIIREDAGLDLSTTLNREFASVLDQYVEALSEAAEKLAHICGRLCRDNKGTDAYSDVQSRDDRVNYDGSVLRYQRLGSRLSELFKLL